MKNITYLIIIIIFCGCANAIKQGSGLSKISLGMTKDKVIAIKGNPIQASAKDGYEYHFYNETKENNGVESNQVFVRFKDGKVDSYGPMSELKISKEPSTSFEKKEK